MALKTGRGASVGWKLSQERGGFLQHGQHLWPERGASFTLHIHVLIFAEVSKRGTTVATEPRLSISRGH